MGCFVTDWPRNCPILRHMLLLSLDTSSPSGSVAVLRDEKVLGVVSTSTDEDYSSRLFRHVEWLLKELSLDLGKFDAFAVSAGPGSFTGLRVGLAAVKGWAEVYNRPIVAVSVLEAIAAQSRASARLLVPFFDARRGELYFGFYRRNDICSGSAIPTPEGEAQVMSPEEFLRVVEAKVNADEAEVAIVTPTPEVLSGWLPGRNAGGDVSRQIRVESVTNVLAPIVGQIGWQRAKSGKFESALTLDANYVRRTDAELKWKGPSEQR
jgi:tRNA threonylcarbamoyl adenosine modification protein YeaZ